jgi:VCBS repeat-containing protein
MTLEIVDDESKPEGGYALVTVSGQGGAANNPLSIVVRRFREGDACLGPRGWQPGEHKFKLEAQRDENGDLVLVIGPQIVNVVEEYDSIELRIPEINFAESLRWPPLTPSLDLPDMAPGEPAPATPPPASDVSNLLDKRDKQREEALQKAEEPAEEEPAPVEEEPVEETEAPVVPEEEKHVEPEPAKRRGALWPILIAVLVVLCLAGAGIYYFLLRDEPAGDNQAPVAQADPGAGGDGFTTDHATAFTTPSVLANDTDADGDALSVLPGSLDTEGTKGLVINNGDGTFEYDPDGQFGDLAAGTSATDTFAYTVTDTNDGTDTATVTITITSLDVDEPEMTPPERQEMAVEALEAGDADTAITLLQENIRENYGPSLLILADYYAQREPAEALRLIGEACEQGVEDAPETFAALIEVLHQKAETDSALKFTLEIDEPAVAAQCGQ